MYVCMYESMYVRMYVRMYTYIRIPCAIGSSSRSTAITGLLCFTVVSKRPSTLRRANGKGSSTTPTAFITAIK